MTDNETSIGFNDEALGSLVAGVFGQQEEQEALESDLPEPPLGSSPRATMYWYASIQRYRFNVAEMAMLEEAIQAMSLLDNLRSEFERTGSEYMVRASHGGLQLNPLVKEQGPAQTRLKELLKALRIPDEDDPSRAANLTSHAARGALGGKQTAANRRASTREIIKRNGA